MRYSASEACASFVDFPLITTALMEISIASNDDRYEMAVDEDVFAIEEYFCDDNVQSLMQDNG